MTDPVKNVCVLCVGIFRKMSFTAECDVPCMCDVSFICDVINNNNMSA